MQLTFDTKLAKNYKSAQQKARVLTEAWVDNVAFCPNCGRLNIDKYPNNRPVADFYCSNCNEDYELKSKQENFGTKIVDGAYRTMMERLRSNVIPNLFLLSYNSANFDVSNFLVVPKHFFVPEIIEKRKPLSQTARRAGWIGCNISFQNIPSAGKIFFIKNHVIEPKKKVLSQWQKTLFLREEKEIGARGWVLDVMKCIEKLNRVNFILDDVYAFERELGNKHPGNRHVKDKIRQQLQILRDKGYLQFMGQGRYCLR
ncbi:restriction endonuclease [Candidatus Giovannonibacteria bacterium RIFCSPLOWO2_12_FULL_44_25]|uniref:Dam-replacing family protein n=3 Tax=Candidatus Giovannoniibacteriota TaxID=1752738 RepID=A0A0G1IDM2_9BACT|nr:MAG: Dam-replacing family protein [Parcubacteria group bacterium GW2011_GWC1_44_10]KKT57315.1 MAG: Dam-replacing family protein [Candidatus Giovannonibacteria bacterium GW2011_GWB1_44_23]KKT59663.1 MAG: Dam-replacing family protein [Candidatus Giovannonibacteria bacterium GW2011_GWA1_44_25]OGF50073.1 MAG: restriction endonuclease [Candidatus Giovannonibacteria bacterium GWA2_45_15]OGF60696.1 MAG: restriction endonuclease [Candidatus Giovannonibacteria bacterium RIFCSPHIGHO2_01_FULL_44_100]O